MNYISIENISILVYKSLRAKHIALKQKTAGQIVLIVPKYCPVWMATSFAKSQRAWIIAHATHPPKQTTFAPNMIIEIMGQSLTLAQGKPTHIANGTLYLSGDIQFFHRRTCDYAKKMLLPFMQQEVARLTTILGVHAGRITLRNTSSRWGSCSSNHSLSFCWKIAFAPIHVIQYLVAHEVAHLVHMNHSSDFWNLVDQLTPYRKEAEKWLKTNGQKLQGIV
ncbi:MAG: M48 family metallopeptidase [Alphaproteobacteria bacterium]|nr:M48 family metallopeptidase [Alphaproteobacteria bacterium]